MMSLFSLSNSRWIALSAAILSFALLAWTVATHEWSWLLVPGAAVPILNILMFLKFREITDNQERIRKVCEAAAKGDLEVRLNHVPGEGSTARIMHAVNQLLDQSDAFVRESRASMSYVADNRYFRRILRRGLAGDFRNAAEQINAATSSIEARVKEFDAMNQEFEVSVKDVVNGVAAAATELHATAEVMSEIARNAGNKSVEIFESARDSLNSIESIAAASEQLSHSISDVTTQVSDASAKAASAVEDARKAREMISKLAESGERIGKISSLINTIADRTDMLAINAAIEASRAGESGRGFAVVSQEVKELARQTSEATLEIGRQIADVQKMTRQAVETIGSTADSIERLDAISASMASAVAQQSANTSEISRHMQQAAERTRSVSESIEILDTSVRETNDAVDQTLEAAGELSRQAETLNLKIENYMRNHMHKARKG